MTQINPPKRRCTFGQPPLAEAIATLRGGAPTEMQPHLDRLADRLRNRTDFRPTAVELEAVGQALHTVRRSMIDADHFTRRHDVALGYFGVTE